MPSSTTNSSDSFRVRMELEREMAHGEKLLWSGRPVQGFRVQRGDAFAIPFSFLFAAFAVFWLGAAYRSGAPWLFIIFGVVAVLVGLYLIFGRFIYDTYQRRHICYGVSDERVLIVRTARDRQVTSLNLQSLGEVTFTENARGGGSLQFGRDMFQAFYGSRAIFTGWPGAGRDMAPRFDLSEDARRVYDLVRKAQADAK
jgi:hypothetical protein